jgi:hypothetical protein
LYLVRDCGAWLEPGEPTTLHWVSHAVEIGGEPSHLDVATGLLSDLRQSRSFAEACLLGPFLSTTEATDTRPVPPPGAGYYYLVRGTCTADIGFGHSSLDPDPRDALDEARACPP